MRHEPPSLLSDGDILDEIEANANELLELARSSDALEEWDLNVVVIGAGVTVAGMVLTGPLPLLGLLLGGASLGVIGVDLARKLGQLKGAGYVRARVDALITRNAALRLEYKRRVASRPPPPA